MYIEVVRDFQEFALGNVVAIFPCFLEVNLTRQALAKGISIPVCILNQTCQEISNSILHLIPISCEGLDNVFII